MRFAWPFLFTDFYQIENYGSNKRRKKRRFAKRFRFG